MGQRSAAGSRQGTSWIRRSSDCSGLPALGRQEPTLEGGVLSHPWVSTQPPEGDTAGRQALAVLPRCLGQLVLDGLNYHSLLKDSAVSSLCSDMSECEYDFLLCSFWFIVISESAAV